MRLLILCIALAACDAAQADPARARANYLLHCMGCHTEDGTGLEGKVPSMRGTLARIARSPEGRAYLLRVPGVTQSTLSAAEIAEVLNWALAEFSEVKAVRAVAPFTAEEVAAYKSRPLLEVLATRDAVLRGE